MPAAHLPEYPDSLVDAHSSGLETPAPHPCRTPSLLPLVSFQLEPESHCHCDQEGLLRVCPRCPPLACGCSSSRALPRPRQLRGSVLLQVRVRVRARHVGTASCAGSAVDTLPCPPPRLGAPRAQAGSHTAGAGWWRRLESPVPSPDGGCAGTTRSHGRGVRRPHGALASCNTQGGRWDSP